MKRTYLLFSALMLCAFTFAQQVVPVSAIVPGQKYNIKHVDAGLYLSYAEGGNSDFALAELPAGGDVNFDFSFTPIAGAENTYNVGIAGQYLNGSGYNVFLGDATGTNGQVLLTGSETFTMKTLWSNFINLDATTAGSKIFGNKGTGAVWQLELSANALNDAALLAVAKALLLSAITDATALYNASQEGTAVGQYPAAARAALNSAIAVAQTEYDNASATRQSVMTAITTLKSALTVFYATIALPQAGKKYTFQHSEGLFLTVNPEKTGVLAAAKIEGDEPDASQVFLLLDAGTGIFNIANASAGFLYNNGAYATGFKASLGDLNEEKIVFAANNGYFTVRALSRTDAQYLGINNTGATAVYFDKAQSLGLWRLTEVTLSAPLQINGRNPGVDAPNVYKNTPVTVSFNDVISENDFSGIKIENASGVAVTGVSASVKGMTLTIAHDDLAYETTYTVTIPAGAISGYTEPIIWSFTTAASAMPKEGRFYNIVNTTSNYLLTLPDVPPAADSPFSAASKVEGRANQVFLFEKADPADPSVYNILSYSAEEYVAKVTNSAWSMTTSADPTADLSKFVIIEEGQNIKIQALTQAIKTQYLGPNNATNGAACYLDKTVNITWRLEEANVPLALYKTLPKDNAKEVALDAPVSAQFNKDITVSNLETVTIKDTVNNVVVSGVLATANGGTITIAHNEFAFGTTYTVVIPANVVEGITEPTTWSFTTETAPAIASVTPARNVADVAIAANTVVKIDFDKAIIAGDLSGVTISANGMALEGVLATVSEQALSITHPAFDYSTQYTVTIPAAAVKGFAGDSWTFTTTAAPVVKSTTPATNFTTNPPTYATNVALTTLIRVTYDKQPVAGSAGLDGVTLKNAAGDDLTGKISISGSALVIAKATGVSLAEGTVYTVTVPANTIKGITEAFSYSFTTVGGGSGIGDVNADNAVVVYSTTGSINVHTPSAAAISIADISGKQLATYQSNGDIAIPIDYAKGLYIVRVNINGSISSHKVIVK